MSDSKKILIEKIAVAILFVIMALSFMHSKQKMAGKAAIAAADSKKNADITVSAGLLKSSGAISPADTGEPFRDPMRMPDGILSIKKVPSAPVVKEAPRPVMEEAKKLTLEGVIWGGKENLAIVSGKVVSRGETIGGATVSDISEKGVTLTKDGAEIKLTR